MQESALALIPNRSNESEVGSESEKPSTFYEYQDEKGRTIFQINPVGLDKMSPDKIESWQLVLPMTAFGNEVGSIKIAHETASGKRTNYFPNVIRIADGDRIILTDKKTNQTETLVVSISPNEQDLTVSLEQ